MSERKLKVYLIGSLRNEAVPSLANELRQDCDVEVFDDWYSAGPEADDYWKSYSQGKGQTYEEALKDYAAQHVFEFDLTHLLTSDVAILAMPAGKSGHLELGFMCGLAHVLGDRSTAILLDNPDRWDVMYQFAGLVTSDKQYLKAWLENRKTCPRAARIQEE